MMPRQHPDLPLAAQRVHPGERGLTLLEMLAVLAIIALISALAAPQVIGYLDRSRVDTAEVQIKSLETILDMYRLDVGAYPPATDGLTALMAQPAGVDDWRGPYLQRDDALTDPWGNGYAYAVSDDGQTAQVFSYGSDGVEGGEGNAADIGR